MLLWQKFYDDRSDRIERHQAAVGRNWLAVALLKREFEKDDPDAWAVNEAWDSVGWDDQMLLWLAPTKGGTFTTQERKQFIQCMSITAKSIREGNSIK